MTRTVLSVPAPTWYSTEARAKTDSLERKYTATDNEIHHPGICKQDTDCTGKVLRAKPGAGVAGGDRV